MCRIFRPTSQSSRLWMGLTTLVVALVTLPAQAQQQDLEQLRQRVTGYLENHYRNSGAHKVRVTVKRLDPRLRLAECDESLELSLNDTAYGGGNVSVHSQCLGPKPWSIYVPAQVDLYRPVAVAGHNLARGATVTKADLDMVLKNTSHLRQGFVDAPEQVLGMELRRSLKRGEPFRSAVLVEPLAVERGEEVRLEAQAGGISVSARGTAMSSGRVGEQIRVKNNRSQRIVTGQVVAPGQVKTVL